LYPGGREREVRMRMRMRKNRGNRERIRKSRRKKDTEDMRTKSQPGINNKGKTSELLTLGP
jgi:hypothetical protein